MNLMDFFPFDKREDIGSIEISYEQDRNARYFLVITDKKGIRHIDSEKFQLEDFRKYIEDVRKELENKRYYEIKSFEMPVTKKPG